MIFMQITSRYVIQQIDHWRKLIALTAVLSSAAGTSVEMSLDMSHSLPWAAIGCALLGVTGAFTVILYDRKFSWMGHAVPGWIAGPAILFVGGWLLDFKHGLVTTHQMANYAAFSVGMLIGFAKMFGLGSAAAGFTSRALQTAPSGRGEAPSRGGSPKFGRSEIRHKPRTTTQDLPGLIRELALALNNNFQMTERQKKFVEDNLLAAVNGLIKVKRIDKAAQLCRKVPSNWIKFEIALDGLDLEDGLKLAMASFKVDDWGTALRLLDWSLRMHPGKKSLEARVFNTATVLAEQVRVLDDAFEAKVVALQLSPKLSQILKNTNASTLEYSKRA